MPLNENLAKDKIAQKRKKAGDYQRIFDAIDVLDAKDIDLIKRDFGQDVAGIIQHLISVAASALLDEKGCLQSAIVKALDLDEKTANVPYVNEQLIIGFCNSAIGQMLAKEPSVTQGADFQAALASSKSKAQIAKLQQMDRFFAIRFADELNKHKSKNSLNALQLVMQVDFDNVFAARESLVRKGQYKAANLHNQVWNNRILFWNQVMLDLLLAKNYEALGVALKVFETYGVAKKLKNWPGQERLYLFCLKQYELQGFRQLTLVDVILSKRFDTTDFRRTVMRLQQYINARDLKLGTDLLMYSAAESTKDEVMRDLIKAINSANIYDYSYRAEEVFNRMYKTLIEQRAENDGKPGNLENFVNTNKMLFSAHLLAEDHSQVMKRRKALESVMSPSSHSFKSPGQPAPSAVPVAQPVAPKPAGSK